MEFTNHLRTFAIIFLLALSLYGCNQSDSTSKVSPQTVVPSNVITTGTQTPSKNSPDVNPTSEKNSAATNREILETGKRQEIAAALLSEFRENYNKLENAEGDKVEMLTASDRANGLKIFNLTDMLAQELERGKKNILSNINESPVFSGYSKTGVHFIAIVQPIGQPQEIYRQAIDAIRGENNETDLLLTLLQPPDSRMEIVYAMDLYAEGLLQPREQYHIEISEESGSIVQHPISDPLHYDAFVADTITQTYNREMDNEINTIKNKQWKFFLFKVILNHPQFTISIDGEQVSLTH